MDGRENLSLHNFSIQLLRRPYQSSIKINIKPNGQIYVSTSKKTPLRDVLNFLEKSRPWIQKKSKRSRVFKEKIPS